MPTTQVNATAEDGSVEDGSAAEDSMADSHEIIRVQGARENNLKGIDVDLPKRRLTVFTGVSGSGKSSLVFGTIAAESQRLINETYSSFVQGFMPTLARPDVDVLEGLTTAIIVDQERMGANVRSTVGTVTDANAMLRILFSRLGTPHIGSAKAFSFNVATVSGKGAVTMQKDGKEVKERREFSITGGMCPRCEGLGRVSDFDFTAIYDAGKSLSDGGLTVPGYSMDGWYGRLYGGSGYFDMDKPIGEFTDQEFQDLLYREPTKIKVDGINLTYEGVIPRIQKSMLSKERESLQPHIRAFVDRAITFTACPDCEGTRLNDAARSSKIKDISIADACAMQISDLADWVREIEDPSVAPLLNSLTELLDSFVDIGLGYLALERSSSSLSGGEAQRTKMIRHLGSPLTDVTYVFDEPTVGLHPHDIARMNTLLADIRDKGNTVLVVEHKPEVIAIADHVIDIGPGAGADGGAVVYAGPRSGLVGSGSITGQLLDHRPGLRDEVRRPTGRLEIRDARANNLTGVDVDVPTGVLTAVTGVAGSGKSSLIHGSLAGREGVLVVDQSPIRASPRSNPATFTGLLDPIRTAFARANGVKPSLFSANSEGACPECRGHGVIYTDLGMMQGVTTPCEECEGRRFRPEVLEHRLHGLAIDEVLDLSVAAGAEVFTTGKPATLLGRLLDVGLPYLRLGQPLTTLSGGECQRLKLAARLRDARTFVLDEPSSGLHLADTATLVGMLHRLVDGGASVIVIEHNLAVIGQADHVIDIGPGAGHEGGRLVFEGTPAEMVASGETLTADALRAGVG